MTAKFIVIEGIDATGKSTQIKLLSSALEKMGNKCFITQEPSQSKYGKEFRKNLKDKKISPLVNVYVSALDRISHLHNEIIPNIKQGNIVISDRYVDSTIAYQCAENETDFSMDWISSVNKFATLPDIVILLTIDIDEAINRINKRSVDKDKFENKEFLIKVQNNFKLIPSWRSLTKEKLPFYIIIDANMSIKNLHYKILYEIKKHL